MVAALLSAGLSAALVATILLPIQSVLPELLDAPRDATAWAVTITLLTNAIATPIAGKLGDMYGRRRVLLSLLALQLVGAVTAALAATVGQLIVGRGLQGVAMGAIPLGIAIMRDRLPARSLGPSIGFMSATIGLGGALGLPLAGFVTMHLDWHALFWISGAMSLTSILLILWLVPESPVRARGALDVLGGVLLAGALTALLLGITQGQAWGWVSWPTLGALAGGSIVLGVWVAWELRVSNPIADLRVAFRPTVLLTNLTSTALSFAVFAGNIIFPQLLAAPAGRGMGAGLSLEATGLVLLAGSVALVVASPIAGRLLLWAGPRMMLCLGGVISVAAYVLALCAGGSALLLTVSSILVGLAAGTSYAAMPTLIMRAVPITDTGAANGLNALMRAIGTTLAAASIGTVYATGAVSIAGQSVPSDPAFTLTIVLALGAGAIGAIIALMIPGGGRRHTGEAASAHGRA
ncbi:MFS transporter [Microbacterium sp. 18062]|uniref:MFS transporter n=1 Tax=Microbacterium sp. 18062 TaxID=2681410 RepID=UPI00190FB739|nr:MFS transporter [Microbacterium sp. 18062]